MIRIEMTTDRPKDCASAVVDGQRLEARSSAGAIFALCRLLVAAGVPDQAWDAVNTAAHGVISLRGRSVHASAGLTVEQRNGREARFAQFVPRPGIGPQPYGVRSPVRAEPSGGVEARGEPSARSTDAPRTADAVPA
jgi:hypothetical protein